MCLAVYLASDCQMPLIAWNKDKPEFCVVELQEKDQQVLAQFSLPYVVYIGSHYGCSCGYADAGDDAEELVTRTKTVNSLVDYLNAALKSGKRLEMFCCWEGNQAEPPIGRKKLKPEDFLASSFPLEEEQFAEIYSSSNS